MRYLFLLLLLAVFSCTAAYSQQYHVAGRVADITTHENLPGASIRLTGQSDSTRAGAVTDTSGRFIILGMAAGRYTLRITYLGFNTYTATINVIGKDIALGTIGLKPSANALDEVKIVEQVMAVVQKDDTTEYNAGAYKTHPDADAADLIKKMPGIDITGKSVKAQGEDVIKVLIDGKPFFGSDPYAALKELPANVVSKVQVYNEKSDQEQFTGFNEGPTTKTINIITRTDMRHGAFGKVYAGYGEDNKYLVGANINKLNGDQRITVTGQANNVNIQNFSAENLTNSSNAGAGNINTKSAAINYNDKVGKKLDVSASYAFNTSNSTDVRQLRKQYVLPADSGQIYYESSNNNNTLSNHRLDMRINYKIDSVNSFLFTVQGSLQNNLGSSYYYGYTLQADTLNRTQNNTSTSNLAWNAAAGLLYRHSFPQKGRTLSLNLNVSDNSTNGNNHINADNVFYNDSISHTSTNQYTDIKRDNLAASGTVNYTQPLSKTGTLKAEYTYSYQPLYADQSAYQLPGSATTEILDSLLSNRFTGRNSLSKIGGSYQQRIDKLLLSFGVYYQANEIYYNQSLPYTLKTDRIFSGIIPVATLQYRITPKKNLQVNYTTGTVLPNALQLQDVINNTNQLQLFTGNPFLKQSYSYNIVARYSSVNPKNLANFSASLSGSVIKDMIANNTVIATRDTEISRNILLLKASQLVMPVNVQGNYSIRLYTNYSMPVKALKTNVNVGVNANITRLPSVVNGQANFSNNKSVGVSLGINSNISERLDFNITTSVNDNLVNNSLNTTISSNYISNTTSASVNWLFLDDFIFNTSLHLQYNSGLPAGYDQSNILWNVSFGKKILYKHRGDLRFTVFDLLNHNNSIQHTITDTYIADVHTTILKRYYLLTFTYNIKAY
ncbi:MAG: TonB-dependent receptor [Taibaiella sp.]|nr:TonB-dependent receptor [Taibaiella sp.]